MLGKFSHTPHSGYVPSTFWQYLFHLYSGLHSLIIGVNFWFSWNDFIQSLCCFRSTRLGRRTRSSPWSCGGTSPSASSPSLPSPSYSSATSGGQYKTLTWLHIFTKSGWLWWLSPASWPPSSIWSELLFIFQSLSDLLPSRTLPSLAFHLAYFVSFHLISFFVCFFILLLSVHQISSIEIMVKLSVPQHLSHISPL